jgi:hypothetical protein
MKIEDAARKLSKMKWISAIDYIHSRLNMGNENLEINNEMMAGATEAGCVEIMQKI